MEDLKDFTFAPLPPIPGLDIVESAISNVLHLDAFSPSSLTPAAAPASTLGPLRDLVGTWKGDGFNVIWRPHFERAGDPPKQDRFLEINFTEETLQFDEIQGEIPNRGLLQPDINMFGVHYLQKISDRVVKSAGKPAGLHVEPGIWAIVPATTDPKEPKTVVRMASIPHGTTILAQGVAIPSTAGGPRIPSVSIMPFAIGGGPGIDFPEQHLNQQSKFRSPPADIPGLSQQVLDNPNLLLKEAIQNQHIVQTTTLVVSTDHTPVIGGGTVNTAFLQGAAHGPNASAVKASAIFWIEEVNDPAGGPAHWQLQYTQTVLLNFNGLSWPHVSVATLRKQT